MDKEIFNIIGELSGLVSCIDIGEFSTKKNNNNRRIRNESLLLLAKIKDILNKGKQ